MSHDYNSLLRLAYEIEGLLLLQHHRGSDAQAAVDDMLAEKTAQLADAFRPACDDGALYDADANMPSAETDAEIAESAVEEEVSESEGCDVACEPGVQPDQLTLEEKLARERARDIFKAFTLNDKFRFRRELFRDSQEEFDDALRVISGMSDVSEAEEYVYDDLCLDPDNEDVKAFMDVVIKHF